MAEDDLPDPLEPAATLPHDTQTEPFPKGDLRVASWIALGAGAIVVLWYLGLAVFGGVYLDGYAAAAQLSVWALALVSFVTGLLCLNARRSREFAAAGFIAGIVALLVSLTFGVTAGLQVIF